MMANFTCLAAARHALLADAGWDVEAKGLYGAPEVTVIVGRRRTPRSSPRCDISAWARNG
jgi:hypothetical protein